MYMFCTAWQVLVPLTIFRHFIKPWFALSIIEIQALFFNRKFRHNNGPEFSFAQ